MINVVCTKNFWKKTTTTVLRLLQIRLLQLLLLRLLQLLLRLLQLGLLRLLWMIKYSILREMLIQWLTEKRTLLHQMVLIFADIGAPKSYLNCALALATSRAFFMVWVHEAALLV